MNGVSEAAVDTGASVRSSVDNVGSGPIADVAADGTVSIRAADDTVETVPTNGGALMDAENSSKFTQTDRLELREGLGEEFTKIQREITECIGDMCPN